MFGKYRSFRVLNGGNKQPKPRIRVLRPALIRSSDGRVLTVPFVVGPNACA
jgi:hypothetical protein